MDKRSPIESGMTREERTREIPEEDEERPREIPDRVGDDEGGDVGRDKGSTDCVRFN